MSKHKAAQRIGTQDRTHMYCNYVLYCKYLIRLFDILRYFVSFEPMCAA